MNIRESGRIKRHRRIRKRLLGAPERPRLYVFRSHKHLYAQIINDFEGVTVIGCSTQSPNLRKEKPRGGNVDAAIALGGLIATEAVKRGIRQVVFDRGGYQYHGRIKALAEAARKGGLEF